MKSSSLTSGFIFRLIRPPLRTVGVNESLTPNSLKATVTVGKPEVVVEATGTGNSPPAKKSADFPDKAIRLGSANRRNMPFCSRALMKTSTP